MKLIYSRFRASWPSSSVSAIFGGVAALVLIFCGAVGGRNADWFHRRSSSGVWSKPASWGGKVNGPDVTIPAGTTVTLDESPPPMRSLTIDGTLAFADKDIRLAAGEITVHGAMRVGTERRPFQHRAEIVLGSTDASGKADTNSSWAIDVMGGVLDLHGRHHAVNWTHLASTADTGSTTLHLADAVDWRPGDEIVVASTDYDASDCETFTVKAVSDKDVTVDHPLVHEHNGEVEDGVDERAEVGLLTRNVVVHGIDAGAGEYYGGQIMMMHGGMARIADTECYHMGQRGRLGCYPIHFHRLGASPSSYVQYSSVHHCYNRCITIHGTNGVHLTSNVCFDTIGHCYFFEDGVETNNVLRGNLGLMTRRAEKGHEVLASDLKPATFWITNPDNIIEDNCAAGSEEFGFWYALPKHPTGASRTASTDRSIWPRRTALGIFRGNVAHSNGGDGLNVDNAPNPPGVSEAPTYTPPSTANFCDFTAYKNRKHGAWIRGVHTNLVRCRLADNPIGVTLAASESEVSDGLIVGATSNQPDSIAKPDQPDFPIRGFEFYDGIVGVKDTEFENFEPNARRGAGALSYLRYSPFFVDPRNWAQGCRFDDCNRVYFDTMRRSSRENAGDGYRSAVFVDRDGSVTGHAGMSVAVGNPVVVGAGAEYRKDWNAYVQSANYARLFIDDRSTSGPYLGPVSIRTAADRSARKLWGVPDATPRSFQSVVMTDCAYAADLTGRPHDLRITLRSYKIGDWVDLSIPLHGQRVDVYEGEGTKIPLLPAPSPVKGGGAQSLMRSTCSFRKGLCVLRLVVPNRGNSAVAHVVFSNPSTEAMPSISRGPSCCTTSTSCGRPGRR